MPKYDIGIHATNLKCIGPSKQGIQTLSLINIIIGRNNSGKSSLLDLIEISTSEKIKTDVALHHNGIEPNIYFDFPVSDELIKKHFPENTQGGDIPGRNHYQYGKENLSETRISSRFIDGKSREFIEAYNPKNPEKDFTPTPTAREYLSRICSTEDLNPFKKKEFRRLHAERNIQPEADEAAIAIHGDGRGATNAIQSFINKTQLNRDLVRRLLLDDLNSIFGPDTIFEEIVCRHHPSNAWEIFLSEKNKGLVSLSNSGSGLKTVILALCFIHLEPVLSKKPLNEFIFAFEELENNLHPAIQRRLLNFLADKSVEHQFPIFLTTHSSIAIDLFSKHPEAQILHVTHNGSHSIVSPVRAYIESRGILDDLDVRASDLLQSNGVIWVEGPSDRVYINHWIDIWSNGELKEGNHYQCIFYGGRLLSHISSEVPEETENDQGVAILRVNRNACVVIDSDKRDINGKLNETKLRVLKEIESIGGLGWVTDGREIENYIPFNSPRAWSKELALIDPPAPYESVFEYLDAQSAGIGKKYEAKKAIFAEALNQFTRREDLVATPQLSARIATLCEKIREWNRLPEPAPPA